MHRSLLARKRRWVQPAALSLYLSQILRFGSDVTALKMAGGPGSTSSPSAFDGRLRGRCGSGGDPLPAGRPAPRLAAYTEKGQFPFLTANVCSCRTYVRMVACILIPAFELRVALRARPRLALAPAALAPAEGEEPLLGPVTAAADQAGVKPGMRMGEALATCPELVLVEQDPAAAEQAWEEVLRRLEDAGFAVEPTGLGSVFFETRGVERLYGGVEAALERALAAVGSAWDARAGASYGRRFAALAAANVARPGQVLIVADERTRDFLAPLPLALLPLAEERR